MGNYDASRYLRIDGITGEIFTAVKFDRELIGTSLRYTLQAIDKSKNVKNKGALGRCIKSILFRWGVGRTKGFC